MSGGCWLFAMESYGFQFMDNEEFCFAVGSYGSSILNFCCGILWICLLFIIVY